MVDVPDDIAYLAWEMLELLKLDVEESEMARQVYDRHCEISEEEYLAVWELLEAKDRRAWKLFVEAGKKLEQTR